jgi:hypothetical protein
MTTETTNETAEPSSQEVFASLVEKFGAGTDLTREEVEFLITLVGSLDINLRVSNEMLSTALGTTQELLGITAGAVLRKCGRTDMKIRNKIAKMCEENFDSLITVVRLHGQTIQTKLTNPEEDINAE